MDLVKKQLIESVFAEIGKRLGRKALRGVARVAQPDTILAWYRKPIGRKFDGSKYRRYPGRPRIRPELEALVVRMARENSGWGYDRVVGALANLGHPLSDQTVGNILHRQALLRLPSEARPPRGKTLFPRIWMCWQAPTSYREARTRIVHCRSPDNVVPPRPLQARREGAWQKYSADFGTAASNGLLA
jgi:hypothetical protein